MVELPVRLPARPLPPRNASDALSLITQTRRGRRSADLNGGRVCATPRVQRRPNAVRWNKGLGSLCIRGKHFGKIKQVSKTSFTFERFDSTDVFSDRYAGIRCEDKRACEQLLLRQRRVAN